MISTTRCPSSLELGQLGEHDDVSEVDVGSGRVDAELHAKRVAPGELLGEPPCGEHLLGSAREGVEVSHA